MGRRLGMVKTSKVYRHAQRGASAQHDWWRPYLPATSARAALTASSGPVPWSTFAAAAAPIRWAARRAPMMVVSDIVRQNRYGEGMKFRVCSLPSKSTTVPASPIFCTAFPANFTTSPCVSCATVGMFLPTLASFSTVSAISETRVSRPRPLMRMSNFPSNCPNSSMPAQEAKFSGVRQAGSNSDLPCCSHHVTARSVNDRKQFPFDHVEALGSFALILSTVVPLPVPLSPTRIITHPPSLGNLAIISSATSSAVFPKTSTCS
mmetsp:Transcript_114862/g.297695  ORF Transcript_114862/g.297695 Transcript_114862/m.297695 type:complete len:263 (-) Transcript_114862:302-1090(-)